MPVSARSFAGHVMHSVNPKSQNGKVLLHLIKYGSLTQVLAHELYRVYRLASRINDLKHLGVTIAANSKTDSTGTRYVEYSI
jgi:hypothetical protein